MKRVWVRLWVCYGHTQLGFEATGQSINYGYDYLKHISRNISIFDCHQKGGEENRISEHLLILEIIVGLVPIHLYHIGRNLRLFYMCANVDLAS